MNPPWRSLNFNSRHGLTVVELLVALSVVALLLALLVPAVQSARETARRIRCQSHLKQIITAVLQYDATFRVFPAGWGDPGYIYRVLPYLSESALFAEVSAQFNGSRIQNADLLLSRRPQGLVCPSSTSPADSKHVSNYAGNCGLGLRWYVDRDGKSRAIGYDGIFSHLKTIDWWESSSSLVIRPVRVSSVTDGLSSTAALSEIVTEGSSSWRADMWFMGSNLHGFHEMEQAANECQAGVGVSPESTYGRGDSWLNGDETATLYNHAAVPNHRACLVNGFVPASISPASSEHGRGVNVAYADGRVTFVSESIDRQSWIAQGTRNSAELIAE